MSLVNDMGGLSAADVAAVTGNGNNGWGGDSSWWLIILFLFALTGNGWGNGNGNGSINADMQRGFDQQAVMSGITGIGSAISNGFGNAEVSATNRQMANMQQLFGLQTAIDSRLDTLAMNQQNCCCENRAQTADLKYTLATESANTRSAVQSGNQTIMDKLCQLELDGIKQNYENRIAGMQNQIDQLTAALNSAQFNASQSAQTAQIIANNDMQTGILSREINPPVMPSYTVPNPNAAMYGNYYGCNGCAA